MKRIYWQKWTKAVYRGYIKNFPFWSNMVKTERDATLATSKNYESGWWNWLLKNWSWKKFVVLRIDCQEGTIIRPGFNEKKSNKIWLCRVSSAVFKVSPDDNLIALRMGPEDCEFFIIADKDVRITIAGYTKNDIILF